MKTHSEKIREALIDLVEARPKEIMDWISNHYPEDTMNEVSYRSDLIALASNHSSTHHYPMPESEKFLLFNDKTKEYCIDSSKLRIEPTDGRVEALVKALDAQPQQQTTNASTDTQIIDGIPLSKLSVTGQIAIPFEIREKLSLSPGDTIAFIINEKGIVELRKARLRLDLD
jgi:AbrB family looped-hinge helix DNA binding protein